jgi:MFS transporter, Spinster family, sphingosine-1-phosphate transporter
MGKKKKKNKKKRVSNKPLLAQDSVEVDDDADRDSSMLSTEATIDLTDGTVAEPTTLSSDVDVVASPSAIKIKVNPPPNNDTQTSTEETKEEPKINRRNTAHFLNHLTTAKGLSHEHSMAAIVQEKQDVTTRKRVFMLMCLMQLFANFDAGVIPAALNEIMTEYDLKFEDAGWLGSLVYIGLVCSCPITGYLLTKMKSQRKILVASLSLNIIALTLFVLCPGPTAGWDAKALLMFTRFLTGLSQAPLFVFPPVWVDEFGPEDSMTAWVASLQAMVPLGIMFGFLFTALFQREELFGPKVGWRAAIWMQIIALTPFVFMFIFLRGRYFNVLGGKEARLHDQAQKIQRASLEQDHATAKAVRDAAIASGQRESQMGSLSDLTAGELPGEEDEETSMSDQLCRILNRPVFLWIVLGLSGLYFVVTGIQFWTASYMINVIGAKQFDVQIAFTISSLTGPLLGVLFGSWLVDKMGGYKEDTSATANTLMTCNLFGMGAVACAIPAAFVQSFAGAVTCIWLILFFGGALLPALTGICVASVPADCRAVASSFSMFTYNILGYALAPVLMGSIATSYVEYDANNIAVDPICRNLTLTPPCADKIKGQTIGFQVGMFTASVAWFATIGATISQLRLASNGAKPACLAWLPYNGPDSDSELLSDDVTTTTQR